ncbi:hypothetical protein Bca52824_038447 [Brassica carinata]|uniref:Uncharacterized protein n=1 Tax=Brassica carinata TaxID=52824 RepID=A0A8X7RPN0_BRACI|nr:hypothetical protein Bca52824_038447 [Brassica carinata]
MMTALWEGKDSVLQMMNQVASCLLLAKLCYELNPQVKQPQLPQAYLGEEDQLRPSSPFVRLGMLWSPCLSQYLIRTVDVRGRVKLEVSSPVHSVSWFIQPCSSGTQVLSKPVSRQIFRMVLCLLMLPGDRVLHDDAVSDCSYRTFDNDGDANSLVSTLSVPCMRASRNQSGKASQQGSLPQEGNEEETRDLRSRGLCLVPLS